MLKVKQLRLEAKKKDKKFTQAFVAEECDMSITYLDKIENGRFVPKAGVLQRIAEFYNEDAETLLVEVA